MTGVRSVLLLTLFLLWGCDFALLTSPAPVGLDFSWEAAEHGQWLEQPEVEVMGGDGTILVTSRLSAANPCQRLEGQLERSTADLTLRVTILPVGEGCYQIVGTFRYTAVIREVAPGAHDVRVVHEYPGTGWPSGLVREERVVVE